MRYVQKYVVSIQLATLLPLVMGFMFSGCAQTNHLSKDKFLNYDEVIAEYQTESDLLELAPGYTWPEVPHALSVRPPEGHVFEQGIGKQEAQFIWYCSWAKRGVEFNDYEALSRLRQIQDMSVWSHMDDVGHEMFKEIDESLVRKNLTPVREYVSSNCED